VRRSTAAAQHTIAAAVHCAAAVAAACARDLRCFRSSATVISTVTSLATFRQRTDVSFDRQALHTGYCYRSYRYKSTYPDEIQKGSTLEAASMRIKPLQQANPKAAASVRKMYATGLLRGSL
jgi:hypothetical protein